MGEKSRFIGEVGEDVAERIFSLLGWSFRDNLEFSCKDKKHAQRTHDIDKYTYYRCPLENDVIVDVAVSIKYNDKTTGYKSEFVKYAESLVKALSCFKKDTIYNELSRGVFSKSRKSCHVLFWLNHSQAAEKDFITEIGDVSEIAAISKEEIVLVDNQRVTFLIDSIDYANSLFKNAEVTFVYPKTGYNETLGGRKLDGKILPVNLLNSPVLPFKIVTGENKKVLVISVNEPFDDENLKRIIGLAQNLTDGWCNKIIIAYPDYQHLKHNGIKQSVLLMFNESGFAEMIDVQCYKQSFRSYESALLPMIDSGGTKPEFNVETLLPYGDQLRQLLNQSYIYKGDLLLLLRRRGVYVGADSSKETLVPKLCKTLISPNEFEFLKMKQSTKESSEKITNEKVSVANLEKADEALNDYEMPVQEIIEKNNNGCELLDFSREYDYEGNIRYRYKIKRQDLTKDWASIKSEHAGEIVIVKQQFEGGVQGYRIDRISTSQETKDINKKLAANVIEHLKEIGTVKKAETSKKITSDEFDELQLASLLFSFMEIEPSKRLKFKSTIHIDFKPNDRVSLPEDIASLKDKVEHSIFEGNNLQDIKYVSNPKYREMFVFANITSIFHFKIDDYEGDAKIEYGFPDLLTDRSKKEEFEYKVLEVVPFVDRNLSTKEIYEIKEKVTKEFASIVNDNYLNYQRKYGVQLGIGI